MLFMSNARTAPSPRRPIAWPTRPSRYSWSRLKSTRSSQSTAIRPGAGTEVTVNSDGIVLGLLADRLEPIGDFTALRLERQIGPASLALQEGREIDVATTIADQADD